MWVRAQLLHRLLPPGDGIVLGISLGDHWSEIAKRSDRWFTCSDRRLERRDPDGSVIFQARDERDVSADDVYSFQLDVRGSGANLETVHGIAADLRASFRERFGQWAADEMYMIYNLPPHAYDTRLKLWTQVTASADSVRFTVWPDI